jgi:hypothetical protein
MVVKIQLPKCLRPFVGFALVLEYYYQHSLHDGFSPSTSLHAGIQLLLKLLCGIGDPPQEGYYGLMCVSAALALAAAAFA